jgi:hypothetical protein
MIDYHLHLGISTPGSDMLWDESNHNYATVDGNLVEDVIGNISGAVEYSFCVGVGEHDRGSGEVENLARAVF